MIACISARFPFGVGHRRRSEIGQKFVHRRDIARSLIFQLISSVIFIAEKLGAFRAQLRDANHDRPLVQFAALAVPRERSFHDLFAQWPILQ